MNKQQFLILFFFISAPVISLSQNSIMVDGDLLYLKDTLGNNIILDTIIRGNNNTDALWLQYDRRPNVDPWVDGPTKIKSKYLEENFIQYFKDLDIEILGALNTFDNCGCSKTKAMHSPDMILVNFKILKTEWDKLIEFYPNLSDSKIISKDKSH